MSREILMHNTFSRDSANLCIDRLTAGINPQLLKWKKDVEDVQKIERLAYRKSFAIHNDITGFTFGEDNVGWVGLQFWQLWV